MKIDRKPVNKSFFSACRYVFASSAVFFVLALPIENSWAGAPFRTDDPEMPDFKHAEAYIATTFSDNVGAASGTAPYFEFNYGVFPDVMAHVILPFAFNKIHSGPSTYGFGDMELGVKYRFVNLEDSKFMAATFPLVVLPTGDDKRDLGAGHTRFFLPIWLQKSWGPWTSYGGGGWWRNPGENNKDYWFFGAVLQREMSRFLLLGAELFTQTKTTNDGDYEVGFNLGAVINLAEDHHILVSMGRDFHGDNTFSAYLAYLFTFGPHKQPAEKKAGSMGDSRLH